MKLKHRFYFFTGFKDYIEEGINLLKIVLFNYILFELWYHKGKQIDITLFGLTFGINIKIGKYKEVRRL